jgi:hypothetical protein
MFYALGIDYAFWFQKRFLQLLFMWRMFAKKAKRATCSMHSGNSDLLKVITCHELGLH